MPVPGNGVAGDGTVADHGAMTWIAPDVTRVHEPVVADERATLDGLVGEWERCREAVRELPLDHQFRHPYWGLLSLRWVYGHMIAEYARHLGHADLLRECTDGATGE
jgi:hypothetical protein